MALMMGGNRTATARALEPTRVVELKRARFDDLVRENPDLLASLSRTLTARARLVRIAAHLRELFGELDTEAFESIERDLTWLQLPSGAELFRQGDPADGAYIVAVGRLRIVVSAGADEKTIDEVGAGQWIGEMALLTRKERSATVYAVRDTELVWLPQPSSNGSCGATRTRCWRRHAALPHASLDRSPQNAATAPTRAPLRSCQRRRRPTFMGSRAIWSPPSGSTGACSI
jgi:CRP-like cAMP-binding protein